MAYSMAKFQEAVLINAHEIIGAILTWMQNKELHYRMKQRYLDRACIAFFCNAKYVDN